MTSKTKKKHWDVELEVDGVWYRMDAKRYNVRDGLSKTSLELQLTKRYPDNDELEQGTEMLTLVNNFPLLKFGIAAHEGFDTPLTEKTFWNLPEEFVMQATETIRERNPQYSLPFLTLQQTLKNISQTRMSAPAPENTSPSDPSDSPS